MPPLKWTLHLLLEELAHYAYPAIVEQQLRLKCTRGLIRFQVSNCFLSFSRCIKPVADNSTMVGIFEAEFWQYWLTAYQRLRSSGVDSLTSILTHMRGIPPKWNLLIKIVCFNCVSYMFKLQSPPKYSPFEARHLSRCFYHCSEQFLIFPILVTFSVSSVFFVCLFHLFYVHIGKMFPFKDIFFSSKETKKCLSGQDEVKEGAAGAQG